MPTYEYRCPEGHESEDFVLKISDAKPEIPCPTCGAMAARRMSAGSGLLFKGSGFYITDYGKDGKKDLREAKPSTTETNSPDKKPAEPAAKPADAPAPVPAAKAETKPAAPAKKASSAKSE